MSKDDKQLESVKRAFEHWRKTRKKQGKVPDCLWKQVRALTGSYSLTKIGARTHVWVILPIGI